MELIIDVITRFTLVKGLNRKKNTQVALRAVRSRPSMIRALVLVSPAVLNALDSKFIMGRDPNANLFTPIANLRTRVETTARLAAFNLQVSVCLEFQ